MGNKYLLALAVGALMLVACGDDVTEVNEIHQDGMAVLEAGLELSKQKCDSANVGEMLFVMDSSEAFFCDGESWQTLKGLDGKDGEKGADGKDGEDGDNGNDGTSCTAQSVKNAAGLGGLEVTCEKIVIDTIWNGEKGENGNDGEDGVGCTLDDEGDGKVTVSCGKGSAMTTTILYKAVCGIKPYDPAKAFCLEGKVYDLCGGKTYDLEIQYCKMGETVENYGRLEDARDDQVYKTVEIGDQTWMAENLNYSVNPSTQSWCGGGSGTTEGDCDLYGRLYTWAAAVGKSEDECGYGHECDLSDAKNGKGEVRGICPEGWHLPSYREFEELINYIDPDFGIGHTGDASSSTAGKYLKSRSGWYYFLESFAGTDAFGFSALPAGLRDDDGYFGEADRNACFWSASENDDYFAYTLLLYYGNANAYMSYSNKDYAFSVRCLKDN